MTQTPQDIAIALSDVSMSYGCAAAVSGVSLEIRSGEFVCIMGPSGCGKTTTLRMIAGLETPTSGDIYIAGKRVNDVKPWHRDVPLVWQNFALFPHLSVADNVAYGLRVRNVPKVQRMAKVRRMLATVGLEGFEDRSVLNLSGGQKQRVGIARALVLDPQVILLDEPLGALDAKIARSMQQELRRLHEVLGITFVYVTHNQSEAMALADRIVVMNAGRIEQADTPLEILRRPASVFVADFIGANNIIGGIVDDVRTDSADLTSALGRFVVPKPPERLLSKGQSVSFIVGADRMTVGFEPSDAATNEVAVRVTAVELTGGVVTLFAQAKDGQSFHVHVPPTHFDSGDIHVGRELHLSWKTGDSYLLPSNGNEHQRTNARSQ